MTPQGPRAPRVLDVTLRDGGYVNEWGFSAPSAAAIVSALSRQGIGLIEVGYYRPRRAPLGGAGASCPTEYLDLVRRAGPAVELAAMVHPGDVGLDDYALLAEHGISRVRIVVAGGTLSGIGAHVDAIHRARLTCSINLIRVSQRSRESIVSCAVAAEAMGADWLYLADSNGSMFPDRVEETFAELSACIGVPLGFHAHDSLGLAFANALAAVRGGATLLDSSLAGMGKGAGNLMTELIVGYLQAASGQPYELAPLVSASTETLGEWIDQGHARRCELLLAALLDLNIDELKPLMNAANAAQRPLLIELERSVSPASRPNHRHTFVTTPRVAPVLSSLRP